MTEDPQTLPVPDALLAPSATATPEQIAAVAESYTGKFLQESLQAATAPPVPAKRARRRKPVAVS